MLLIITVIDYQSVSICSKNSLLPSNIYFETLAVYYGIRINKIKWYINSGFVHRES